MCGCKGKCGCNITSTTKGEKGDASPVASLGYKVYVALLSQTGTDAPTAIVLQNTLGSAVTWEYYAAGVYLGTIDYELVDNKTAVFINSTNATTHVSSINVPNLTAQQIRVRTSDTAFAGADGLLNDTTVEIRIYP